jgi:hypothetical protein
MKKTLSLLLIISTCLLVSLTQTATAQKTDKPKKDLKNTIHFNLTNPLIFGSRSLVFGYERVINKRQTFTVNFGQQGFPSLNLINTDSLKVKKDVSEKGFNCSVDYRFYLFKLNKFSPPRGVYVGPYYCYNYFEKKHTWSLENSSGVYQDVNTDLSLSVNTVGFELGYQFIFWRRLAVDLILIGPGVSGYSLKASIA